MLVTFFLPNFRSYDEVPRSHGCANCHAGSLQGIRKHHHHHHAGSASLLWLLLRLHGSYPTMLSAEPGGTGTGTEPLLGAGPSPSGGAVPEGGGGVAGVPMGP